MKLGKLSAPKIQWWDRHRITVLDITLKKEKIEGKEESLVPSHLKIQLGKLWF